MPAEHAARSRPGCGRQPCRTAARPVTTPAPAAAASQQAAFISAGATWWCRSANGPAGPIGARMAGSPDALIAANTATLRQVMTAAATARARPVRGRAAARSLG